METGSGAEGHKVIPRSQRPDGTWRKEIKVRAGYTPQDEIGAFETRASRMKSGVKTIPGLPPPSAESKPEKKAKPQQQQKQQQQPQKQNPSHSSNELPIPKIEDLSLTQEVEVDPTKRLRKIKKKLREINELEVKIQNNSLEISEEIEKKLKQKSLLEDEIAQLESSIQSAPSAEHRVG